MKKFKTLSDVKLLYLAYEALFEQWDLFCRKHKERLSLGDEYANRLKSRYDSQLDEIRSEIIRLEACNS